MVLTNPALLSSSLALYKEGIQNIVSLAGEAIVFANCWPQPAEMIREAKEISSWGPQMIVKLPVAPAGIQACAALSKTASTAPTLWFIRAPGHCCR